MTKPYGESSAARSLPWWSGPRPARLPTEKFITTFARYYTPAVVGAAAAVALLPPLLVPGAVFSDWLYRALVLLVISCPCALVLSIPLGYFGGIGGRPGGDPGQRGQLPGRLDPGAHRRADKTGTLTQGVFRVRSVTAVDGVSPETVLEYAAHAEHFSRHPIAASIRDAYGRETDPARLGDVEWPVAASSRKWTAGGCWPATTACCTGKVSPTTTADADGTVVNVAVEGTLIGRLHIGDGIKPDAARAIRDLKRLGVTRTVMLTGDADAAARQVAAAVDIDEVHAGLLPEEKVEVLERLSAEARRRRQVAFAGDGINDAPVLTRADIGIAMGALGSDAAIEAADVVIMDDRPSRLPEAVAVARRTRRIVGQNITFTSRSRLCLSP